LLGNVNGGLNSFGWSHAGRGGEAGLAQTLQGIIAFSF